MKFFIKVVIYCFYIETILFHIFSFTLSVIKFFYPNPQDYINSITKSKNKSIHLASNNLHIDLSLKIYFIMLFLLILSLLSIPNKVVFVTLLIIFILFLICKSYIIIHHKLDFILFVIYSNCAVVIRRSVFQSLIALMIILYQKQLIHNTPSALIILCFLECLLGICSLCQLFSKRHIPISVTFTTTSLLALAQIILVLFYWLFGTWQIAYSFLHYKFITWYEWISLLLFIHNFPFPGIFSFGFLLLLFFALLILGIYPFFNYKHQKDKLITKTQAIIPLFFIVILFYVSITYLSNYPNYINSTTLPKFSVFADNESPWTKSIWPNTDTNLVNIISGNNRNMDGHETLFQNGITMYFDTQYLFMPIKFDAKLTILDDFSDKPYLKLYTNIQQDGIISFYAKNEGGVTAYNCEFKLFDDKNLLKKYFPHNLLHVKINKINPEETVCITILRNQDMLKSCYNEVEIKLTMQSRFTNGLNVWTTSRQISNNACISLRGITNIIETNDIITLPYHTVVMEASETITKWSEELRPEDLGNQTQYTFLTKRTSLVALTITLEDYYKNYYTMPPLIFICEVVENGE